jgi:hypothetical protein
VKEKDEERGDRERQFNLQRARSISSVYRRGGFSLQRKSHTHLISLPLPLWFSPSPHSLAVLMCLFSSYSPSLITPCFFLFVVVVAALLCDRASFSATDGRKEGRGEGRVKCPLSVLSAALTASAVNHSLYLLLPCLFLVWVKPSSSPISAVLRGKTGKRKGRERKKTQRQPQKRREHKRRTKKAHT